MTTGTGSRSRRNTTRRRKKRNNALKAAVAAALILIIAGGSFALVRMIKNGGEEKKGTTAESVRETEKETELSETVVVDGINITGLVESEARKKLEDKYGWKMTVNNPKAPEGAADTYDVSNLIERNIDSVLDDIYSGKPKSSYTIMFDADSQQLEADVEAMAQMWDVPAQNGSVDSFDKETGELHFTGEKPGYTFDADKMKNMIRSAVSSKNFKAELDAPVTETEPEISEAKAKELYTVIGTYKTSSTANSNRNNNLNLACNAIDGSIIQPDEEFTFNHTTGNRTSEKGYKTAAAYQNGVVVEEAGGGVCQVASTLYNAVVFSGLEIVERHAHTFAPTYVTPGEDATVSYDGYNGPDFRFKNTTASAVIVRAHYEDRTVTCSVIGIPILPEGETIELHSEKTATLPVPAPIYEEDLTIQPGTEKQESAGDEGSVWNTYIIHKKNGEVISNELYHTSRYNGHQPKVKRNSAEYWYPNGLEGETLPAGETLPQESSEETTAGYGPGMTPVPSASAASGNTPGSGTGESGGTPAAPAATSAAAPAATSPAAPAETSPAAPETAPAAPADPGPAGGSDRPQVMETVAPMPGF